jgi:hypothetical protein
VKLATARARAGTWAVLTLLATKTKVQSNRIECLEAKIGVNQPLLELSQVEKGRSDNG